MVLNLKVIHYWNYYFITVEGFARVPQPNLWYTVAIPLLYRCYGVDPSLTRPKITIQVIK